MWYNYKNKLNKGGDDLDCYNFFIIPRGRPSDPQLITSGVGNDSELNINHSGWKLF